MIRVLLVDDERLVCAHLRTVLGAAPDIEVAGEAYDGGEAVEAVLRHRPDLVLMDIRMPGVDGLAAIERIVTFPAAPRVVALTTFDVDEYVLRALRAGAVGFLLKSTAPEDLVDLVRVAAAGHTVLSPAATHRLLDPRVRRHAARERLDGLGLTAREVDVLGCLGAGRSNQEIARRLHLSEATVKGYVSRLLLKLDCDNRTQAGLLALAAGLTS
ncbi:DNA-binding response regulator [Virgisporangium aliadipatigenens]|uniref:DNA-binding response regulator n=1 Tax=Virgisporangium aliadipatigenens TaxID=741659 RepID=A0A8J3YE26_9ACTN|nr:response regulator transcription factor [Virgisporangium aliadipatigenens]GIJ43384.1 DNA-binding response regulator [Virgisporangium aliadipatigenens]